MVESIKVLSECFDLGNKEMTYTKGVEFRSKAIENQAVSALFIGSPGHVLYDESTKKKFNIAFMSKLARRSWFCYAPDSIPEPSFTTLEEFDRHEATIAANAMSARAGVQDLILHVTNFGINTAEQPITVSDDVQKLFNRYKRYNNDFVLTLANQDTTYALIRRHLQWKGLKLAGALALFDCSNVIEAKHYIEAMQFCELLDNDMFEFEQHLNRADHELFSDYIRKEVKEDGVARVTVHDMKKRGFISNVSRPKLLELLTLCAGYDPDGVYTLINDNGAVKYEPVVRTDTVKVSFKAYDSRKLNEALADGDKDAIRRAKEAMAAQTAYGFTTGETTFENLADMLGKDLSYCPFEFKNGVRGANNIVSGTKWLVLDIDESSITASEAHFMLMDLNHHIALTSDPNNEFKFRVLLELDALVTVNALAWKHFCILVAEDLALKCDQLPQAQIFFAYSDRPVMSNLNASPLPVRDYVMQALEKANSKDLEIKQLTKVQKSSLLDNELSTFNYVFNCANGQGSRNMIRAAYHARDLGADLHYVLTLIDNINEYWGDFAMPKDRTDNIKEQIKRMYS